MRAYTHKRTLTAVFTVTLGALLANGAQASCEDPAYRVYHGVSTCLNARWNNGPGLSASAQNLCSEHGKVVAEIDFTSAADLTWHLIDGALRTEALLHEVHSIYCCRALSDLCFVEETVIENDTLQYWDNDTNTSGLALIRSNADKSAFCVKYPNTFYCRDARKDRESWYPKNSADLDAYYICFRKNTSDGERENCADRYLR